jgi:hypothetical protein
MMSMEKYAPLQQQILTAVASMNVDTLETIIPLEVILTGKVENDRVAFLEMLRYKFKTVKMRGVKEYKVSTSFCNNCYANKEVIRFSESYGSGFALAFETYNSTLTAIRICHSSGITRENLEKQSRLTFSYF